ncbi:hypothetical protein Btru_022296 [Bulinus truncatus]|nr:hypothetical protein Btru_022296 [Bulinus truncatus]
MFDVLYYGVILAQIGWASTSAPSGPCGGVRGRFICDDTDPQVFHICMGNQKYTNRCPGDLHYNVRTQTCDWPKAVNCVEEARQHLRKKISDNEKHLEQGPVKLPEDNNVVNVNEDTEVAEQVKSQQKVLSIPAKKRKFSSELNPKVENKPSSSSDVLDAYGMLPNDKPDQLAKKVDDIQDRNEVGKSEMNFSDEMNAKNNSIDSVGKVDNSALISAYELEENVSESPLETTTVLPETKEEFSPSIQPESDVVGHMIETFKAKESPKAAPFTKQISRQRARRPALSPYKKSQIINTTRPPITTTTRRSTASTSSSRHLTTSTPAPSRRPVTTSRSPFRKTTVVYHPFLVNRTKPDYREYAPQPTTRRPQDSRQSTTKPRSKSNPYVSSAPYRSATNFDDDITDMPKWYEFGDELRPTVAKPAINSYGNYIGKHLSENDVEREADEKRKEDIYGEEPKSAPSATTKISGLSWVKSSTDSSANRKTTPSAPVAMEKVRNIIRSRNFRDRRFKTTSSTPGSPSTSFIIVEQTKRSQSKTPLAQAWLNERKSHSEIDRESLMSKSPFKKNRWFSPERQMSDAHANVEEVKQPALQETEQTTEVTRQPVYKITTGSQSSKTLSWTFSKTSSYSKDGRTTTLLPKSTTGFNAPASLTGSHGSHQKQAEINSVQEDSHKTTNKLPWWSLSTRNGDTTPNHQHQNGFTDQKQNPFYRRAYLPRHFAVHKPNYQTRTPAFDAEAAPSNEIPEKGAFLYKPKEDQPTKPKERTFELHKESEDERRFSLHRVYNNPRSAAQGEDRKFALHKALNSATNQYSAAAALDKRLGANGRAGAVNAPASSDENTIVLPQTEELAKDIDDKKLSDNRSPIEKYEFKNGKCSSSWCKLPDCRCIGSDVPGELDPKDIPQMVMLTFDDSINSQNMGYYKTLFNGTFKNPNGCPVKGTFFVSGDNSDYDMVRKMYKGGHEIASHTLSHRSPTTWWADAGFDNWEHEIVGMKKRLNEKSGVPLKEITGMRAPFLQVGGDAQYAMLKENKFRYDTSMVTGNLYVNNEPPTWPFTLDTPPDSKTCSLTPCPTRSYPGLWEVPLIRWYGSNRMACAMPDACTIGAGTKGSHKFIEDNFMRHYTTNRAPFGIFIHASWFGRKDGNIQGLVEFLASLSDRKDVWVVSISQALDWIQRPVRLSAINALDSWTC